MRKQSGLLRGCCHMKYIKFNRLTCKLFFTGSLLVVTGVFGYTSFYPFLKKNFAPKSIFVQYEKMYSDAEKKNIATFINNYLVSLEDDRFNPSKFYKSLKEQFKVVKKVCWSWDSFDKAVITVEGTEPSFRVNKRLVCGDKKRLFDHSLFVSTTLDALKCVTIDSSLLKSKLSDHLYTFVQNIDAYLDDYWVNYLGKNRVLLQKKGARSSARLIVDEGMLQGGDKIGVCEFIKDDFMNKGVRGRLGKTRFATYDLRFKNRVCVKVESQIQGGSNGKKNVW